MGDFERGHWPLSHIRKWVWEWKQWRQIGWLYSEDFDSVWVRGEGLRQTKEKGR